MKKSIMTHIALVSSLVAMPASSLSAQTEVSAPSMHYADRIILQSYKEDVLDITGRNKMIEKLFAQASKSPHIQVERIENAKKLNLLVSNLKKEESLQKIASSKPIIGQSFQINAVPIQRLLMKLIAVMELLHQVSVLRCTTQ